MAFLFRKIFRKDKRFKTMNMEIKKLSNGTLLVPRRIEEDGTIGDIVLEIHPSDPEYEKYLEQYKEEQKNLRLTQADEV